MRTILVVDDKPGAPAILQAMLEQSGRFQVLAAASPAEALQIFARMASTIDLVIAEVSMAGMSGPRMAAAISATKPNLPVLFISGLLDHFDLNAILPETRYAFQSTSTIPSMLIEAVDRIFGERRAMPPCAGVG